MTVEDSRKAVPVWVDYLVLALISIICTQVLASNWTVRLTQAPQDETCVAHSLFFANRLLFCNDIYFTTWSPTALSSIINWLPALLFKYANCPPMFAFVALTFLQNLLLPLSMFRLATVVTKSRFIGWLSAGFVMLWLPHHWNMALIGGLSFLPYANWIALPLLIFCIASILEGKQKTAILLLILSSTIHPIMSTLCAASCCLYIILTRDSQSKPMTFLKVVCIGAAATLPSLISIAISTRGIDYLPDSDRFETLLGNPHVAPWKAGFPYGVSAFAAGIITTLSVAISGFAILKEVSTPARKMFISIATVTGLSILTHVAAALMRFPPLLNMINTRSTILFILIGLPYALLFVCRSLESKKMGIVFPSLVLLSAASPLSFAALASAVAGIRMASFKKNGARILSFVLQIFAFLVAAYVTLMRTPIRPTIDHMLPPQVNQVLLFLIADPKQPHFTNHVICLAAAGLVFLFLEGATRSGAPGNSPLRYRRIYAQAACLLLIFAWCIESSHGLRKTEVRKPDKDYAEIQIWARENTLPGDSFVLLAASPQNAWRGVAERPMVFPTKVGEVYKSTALAQQYNNRLKRFYERFGINIEAPDFSNDLLKKLTAADWRDFAQQFKAQYLVTQTSWTPLNLPVAGQNAHYIIYQLTDTRPKPH